MSPERIQRALTGLLQYYHKVNGRLDLRPVFCEKTLDRSRSIATTYDENVAPGAGSPSLSRPCGDCTERHKSLS